jgi:hypothetical protein
MEVPMNVRIWNRRTVQRLAVLLPLLAATAAPLEAQSAGGTLPFGVGEALTYRAQAGRLGTIGRGTMSITGAERLRGRVVLQLCFDFSGRVGPARVSDHTTSLLDPRRMASLRYNKRERSPIFSATEAVEIYPDEQRWEGASDSGATPSEAPLDELSFLYYVRTLPLAAGESHTLRRHFDAERNPVEIRVVGREQVRVPAGEFATVVVEMRVPDRRQKSGTSLVRLFLTDDARRVPVRIESRMPVVGTTVLLLESHAGAGGALAQMKP